MKTLALSALVLASAATQAAPVFSVVNAVRVEDSRTTALAVNDLGQLAGLRAYTVTTADKKPKTVEGFTAFLTQANGTEAFWLGPISGTGLAPSGPGKGRPLTSSFAAINANGAAAGESAVLVGSGAKAQAFWHAMVWVDGQRRDLGTLSGIAGTSTATGINGSNAVVGVSTTPRGKPHAFLYNGTALRDLGTLGGAVSAAAAINDAGTVVGGSAMAKGNSTHPFAYSNGTLTDLGLPAGFSGAAATAISSNGIVAGWGGAGKAVASFVWQNGAFTQLGSLYTVGKKSDDSGEKEHGGGHRGKDPVLTTPMWATGVNASGIVVGNTLDAKGAPRAFVLQGGVLSDLNDGLPVDYAGWTIVAAAGVTDSGYVAAIGLDANKKQYALLLKLANP